MTQLGDMSTLGAPARSGPNPSVVATSHGRERGRGRRFGREQESTCRLGIHDARCRRVCHDPGDEPATHDAHGMRYVRIRGLCLRAHLGGSRLVSHRGCRGRAEQHQRGKSQPSRTKKRRHGRALSSATGEGVARCRDRCHRRGTPDTGYGCRACPAGCGSGRARS